MGSFMRNLDTMINQFETTMVLLKMHLLKNDSVSDSVIEKAIESIDNLLFVFNKISSEAQLKLAEGSIEIIKNYLR